MKIITSIVDMDKKIVINSTEAGNPYKRVFYHQNYIFYNVQKEILIVDEKRANTSVNRVACS